MVTSRVGPIRVFFVTLALAAFLLNWLWEIAQMPAYAVSARSLGAAHWPTWCRASATWRLRWVPTGSRLSPPAASVGG